MSDHVSPQGARPAEIDTEACAREPIHRPGAIQPHGLLLVVDEAEQTIRQISANADAIVGRPAGDLLGRPLAELLGADTVAELHAWWSDRDLAEATLYRTPFRFGEAALRYEAIVHRSAGGIVLEFERDRLEERDTYSDIPLLLQGGIRALQGGRSTEELYALAAGEVRRLTGFDRVMIYRFDDDWNGRVVGEARAEEAVSYLGLHFPSTDIPEQARRLYTLNRTRLIADVHYAPVELVPAVNPATDAPLDMSHSVLRSVSPVHLEYLRNMDVQASMSISILRDGELWGLIACHHRAPRWVNYVQRATCEMLGQVLVLLLNSFEDVADKTRLEQQQAMQQRLLEAMIDEDSFAQGLLSRADDLMALTDAGGVVLYDAGHQWHRGRTPSEHDVEALVARLDRVWDGDELFYTQAIANVYAPAEAYAQHASGLLGISLSRLADFYILWFRPELPETVVWAGQPSKAVRYEPSGTGRLHPRQSFEAWKQVLHGRSEPWAATDVAAARRLRELIMDVVFTKMAQVQRVNYKLEEANKRLRKQSQQMRALAKSLTQAEQDERRRISRILHDDLQQMLFALKMEQKLLRRGMSKPAGDERGDEHFERMERMIEDAIGATRTLTVDLSPPALQEQDFRAALTWLGSKMENMHGLRVRIAGADEAVVPSEEVRVLLFQIVRELLFNVVKHAGVEAATVHLGAEKMRLTVEVQDQGAGFDTDRRDLLRQDGGFGLTSVRERLEIIGGSIEIASAEGEGTRVRIILPWLAGAESETLVA